MTGYVDWSVVAFEVPTAAKWNQLGDNDSVFNTALDPLITGWNPASETWTYASATTLANTNNTYWGTFTISGDYTGVYQAGMYLKFTQGGTVKYAMVLKVAYSAPNTTVTIFLGTAGAFTNGAITLPYYSHMKTPYGFSRDPATWTAYHSDTTDYTTTSATYNNPAGFDLDLPLGIWNVKLFTMTTVSRNTTTATQGYFAVSTANNALSGTYMQTYQYFQAGSANLAYINPTYMQEYVTLAAASTLYAIYKSDGTGSAKFQGTLNRNLLEALCAYF